MNVLRVHGNERATMQKIVTSDRKKALCEILKDDPLRLNQRRCQVPKTAHLVGELDWTLRTKERKKFLQLKKAREKITRALKRKTNSLARLRHLSEAVTKRTSLKKKRSRLKPKRVSSPRLIMLNSCTRHALKGQSLPLPLLTNLNEIGFTNHL